MKKIAKSRVLLLTALIVMLCSIPTFAIGNYGVNLDSAVYSSANPYKNYWGQCTWYAWGRAYEKTGVQLGYRGNASTWTSGAVSTPRENSVAVWTGGEYGHVAFVESYDGTNIYISEANRVSGQYSEGVINLNTRMFTFTYGGSGSYTVDLPYGYTYCGSSSDSGNDVNRVYPNGSVNIDDGIYTIGSKLNTNTCLDVAYGGDSNGTNLWLYERNDSNTQQFKITKQSDGKTYRIQAVCNNLYIDNGGHLENGYNTYMWERISGGGQMWYIIDAGGGWYSFVNHDSGLFLNVTDGSTANGTNIIQCESNGGDSQKFRLFPTGSAIIADGTYNIASKLNKNMRLDVAYAGTSNGTNLWLHDRTDSTAQQFRIIKQSDGKTYRIQAVCNDLYVDNGGSPDNDFNTHMWAKANSGAQLWYIVDVGNGWYSFVNHDSGLCLDVANGSTANGTNIRQHIGNGTDSQKWMFIHAHTLVRTPAKGATTTAVGNIEYWTCSSCGKYFNDAAGKTEITKAQTVIPKLSASVSSGTSEPAPTLTVNAKISKPKAAKKAVTVKWKKISKKNQKKISGIQIQIATDPNFTNIVKTAKAGKKKTSKKISKLAKKTTYYVRVRTYKGGEIGKWSGPKKVKTK